MGNSRRGEAVLKFQKQPSAIIKNADLVSSAPFSRDNLFARKVNFLTLFKGVEGDALEFLIICSTLPSHYTRRGQAGRRLWGFK